MNGFSFHSAQTLFTQVASLIISTATSIIIVRTLGPTGRGTWAVMLLITSLIIMLVSLGMQSSATYFIGKKTFTYEEIAFILLGCALGFGVGPIIAYVVLIALSQSFREYLIINQVHYVYMWSLILLTPLTLIRQYFTAALLGLGQFKYFNLISLLSSGLQLVLVPIFLLLLKWDIFGLALHMTVDTLVVTTFACIYFLKLSQFSMSKFQWNWTAFRAMFGYGAKTYMSNIAWFVNYRADIFLLSVFLTTTAVGYYSVSVGLAEKLYLVPSAIGTVLFPYVASASKEERLRLSPIVIRGTNLIAFVSCLGVGIFAYPIIWLLYGPDFLPSLMPFLILLPAVAVMSLGRVLSSDLNGRGRPGIVSVINIVTGALNVGLNLWLIPMWGINGAAVATLISYTLAVILEVTIFTRITNLSITELVVPHNEEWQRCANWIKILGKHLTLRMSAR